MGCWLGLRALKTLYFYFCKVIKKFLKNWKDFCKEFCKKLWKKNNTWNIRCLESFVPVNQGTSITYYIVDCRILGLEYTWNHRISLNKIEDVLDSVSSWFSMEIDEQQSSIRCHLICEWTKGTIGWKKYEFATIFLQIQYFFHKISL